MEKQKNIIFYLAIIICILSIIFIIKIIIPKKETVKTNSNIANNIIANKQKENVTTNNTNTQKQGLYIKEHYIKNSSFKTIEGIVVNNTNNNYEYLQVEVDCYDKDNYKLETTSDIISELKSQEKWKFKIYINSNTYKYNIRIKED